MSYKIHVVFVFVYNCVLKVEAQTQRPPVALLSVLAPPRPGRSGRLAAVLGLAAAAAVAAAGLSTRRV